MDGFFQDLRQASRSLAKAPLFTVAALLTVALGIGPGTAVFSALDAALWRPLPYPAAERIATLHVTFEQGGSVRTFKWSYPKLETLRAATTSFDGIAAFAGASLNLGGADAPERVPAEMVTPEYFPVLGARPLIGRLLSSGDRDEQVALLGEGLYRRRFGASPDVLGKSVPLNGTLYTVVGVVPAAFQGLSGPADVWIPISPAAIPSVPNLLGNRWLHWLMVVARVKPGVSTATASADVALAGKRVDAQHPSPYPGGETWGASLVPLQETRVEPPIRRSLGVLLGASAFEPARVEFDFVGPDHFGALGVPVRRGRTFDEADRAGAPKVVVVNESLARLFWPGQDPLGRGLVVGSLKDAPATVVGLVADVRHGRPEEAPQPHAYLPEAQNGSRASRVAVVFLRTAGDPVDMISAARSAVASAARDVPIYDVRTMPERIAAVTSRTRFVAVLLCVLAGLAVVLASLGALGVMSYAVSHRRREIGIRVALGADPRDVFRMFLCRGLGLGTLGLIVGTLGAFGLTRFLGSLVYGVQPTDPLTLVAAALLLALLAAIGSVLPARAALGVDPSRVLNEE